MGKVKAVELVAYGYKCDAAACEVLIPVRNESSPKPVGFYVTITRVTGIKNEYKTPEELFFHSKTCLLVAMNYQLSSLTNEVVPRTRIH